MHVARTIAAVAVLLSLGALVPVVGDKPASPLSVHEERGEIVWRISGSGYVTLAEVINHYSDHYGGTIIYHGAAVRGEVYLNAGLNGAEYRGCEIDLFVDFMLREFRYAPVDLGRGFMAISHYGDARGTAPIIGEEELPDYNPGRWVNCMIVPEYTDSGTVAMLSTSGETRSAVPRPSMAYYFVGRADHVAAKARAVRAIDNLNRPHLRTYALPDGADGDKLIEDVRHLSGQTAARMAVLPGTLKLFVSATARELENIDRVLAVILD